jgi:hypothetical protein
MFIIRQKQKLNWTVYNEFPDAADIDQYIKLTDRTTISCIPRVTSTKIDEHIHNQYCEIASNKFGSARCEDNPTWDVEVQYEYVYDEQEIDSFGLDGEPLIDSKESHE